MSDYWIRAKKLVSNNLYVEYDIVSQFRSITILI